MNKKKIGIIIIVITLLIVVSACVLIYGFYNNNILKEDINIKDNLNNSGEMLDRGTTQNFTYQNLVLEVSNVKERYLEERIVEGEEPFTETIFVCYPEAKLIVINADMSDPYYNEDKQSHPQWGVYNFATDTRLKLVDDIDPIGIYNNYDMVYNLEASIGVLRFRFIE